MTAFQDQRPDIICLQEAHKSKVEHLIYLLGTNRDGVNYNVQRESGCSILSRYALKRHDGGGKSMRGKSVRFVTAQVLLGNKAEPIYVTSLHFSKQSPPGPLRVLSQITSTSPGG